MTGLAPAGASPAGDDRRPGVVEEVAAGVRRILAPNPGIMTGPGTNTYLLGDGPVAVIDPGPADDAHLAAILAACGDRLRWVLATHTHADHSPLAARLKELTGAEVLGFGPAPVLPHTHAGESAGSGSGHRLEDAHDAGFSPDRRMADGDRLDVGGQLVLEAVHTPGHCSNHLCFELTGTGLLFSGDHIMSGSTVVIAPPDGDMADYLDALTRVRDRRPQRIAPGHGGMVDDPASVVDHYLAHRRSRELQVLDALGHAAGDGVTTDKLVAALYEHVPVALHPVARYSMWAHLRKLGDEGRARSADADDIAAPWWGAAT